MTKKRQARGKATVDELEAEAGELLESTGMKLGLANEAGAGGRTPEAAPGPGPKVAPFDQEKAVEDLMARLPAPTERQKARVAEAEARWEKRPSRLKVDFEPDLDCGNVLEFAPEHSGAGWYDHLTDAFGTTSFDFAQQSLRELRSITGRDNIATHALIAEVDGIRPENEAEAMLAVQMASTHAVAMKMLERVSACSTNAKWMKSMQEYGTLATKLLRTFTAQMDTSAKLRRKGEQTVIVEHVHKHVHTHLDVDVDVHDGVQAIVGTVNHAGGGGGVYGGAEGQKANQPHAPDKLAALEYAPGTPLRSQDTQGDAMPIAGDVEQEKVPDARRRLRKRQSQRAA